MHFKKTTSSKRKLNFITKPALNFSIIKNILVLIFVFVNQNKFYKRNIVKSGSKCSLYILSSNQD